MAKLSHWGKCIWCFLHTFSFIESEQIDNLHDNKTPQIIKVLKTVINAIPCTNCKLLYIYYLEKLELTIPNKKMYLFYWSVDLHNAVNRKKGKPVWSYKTALDKWGANG